MNINDILSNFSENLIAKKRFYSEVAQVVSVDEDNMLCEVSFLSGNAGKNVRLGPAISEDDTAIISSNLVTLPKVDSFVMVSFINDTTGYISLYSEIDKILRKVGSRYIQIDEDYIELGGDTDFMVRFSELETAYNQLKSDHDDTVGKFNALLDLIKTTWVPVPNDGGAALKAGAASLQAASNSTGDISGAKIDEIKTL